MHVTIHEKRWSLQFKPLKGDLHGYCTDPEKPHRKIVINTEKRPRQRVIEDVIHECLHAASYHTLDEDWVAWTARDIAAILDRLETEGKLPEE